VAVIATTERLIVRQWQDEDAQPLAAIGTDLEFVRFLQGRPWTIVDAVDMIATCRTVEGAIGVTLWALADRRDGALLGYCGFGVTNAACVRTDLIEIGWGVEHSRWGQGLATEAGRELIPLAVRRFETWRLIAKCHADNIASERVMRRIGLHRAGLVRYLGDPTLIYRMS
jgi:RimJ/RimL family protein N-acetyltransferase